MSAASDWRLKVVILCKTPMISNSHFDKQGSDRPLPVAPGQDSGTQRVGVLCRYPAILHELGAEPDAVFAAAGLNIADVADPAGMIPFRSFGKLLYAGVKATGLEHLGLLVGSRASLEFLGPVGILMRNAPTLGEALTDLVRNQHRYVRGSAVYAMKEGSRLFIGYTVHQRQTPGVLQILEGGVAAALQYIAELIRQKPPLEVVLPRSQPGDAGQWHRFLGKAITFGNGHAGILIPSSLLQHKLPDADPRERQRLEEWMADYMIANWPDMKSRLEREIRVRLMTGQSISRESLASWFALSPRTLNRRLTTEGASFHGVAMEARRCLATQLLEDTKLTINEIALTLGYSEHSAFSRAFRSWTGLSAYEWRALPAPDSG